MDILKDISSSGKFLPWLQTENISLAISTYQANCLFLIGTHDDGKPAFVSRTFPHVMGLYTSLNSLWLSTKTQILRLENVLNPELEAHNHQRLYLPRASYTIGDLDVHDLTVIGSQVIFVNSKYSCLATLDPQYSFKPLWQPHFISKLAPEDRCHLNGLAVVEGKPKYVTAISRSDVTDGWRDNRHEGGIVMDIETNEILCDNLSMPHSPRYYQGKLWLHNSGTGYFGYLDIQTGIFEEVTFVPGYARGLAFWNNFALVGLSKPRDQTFSGLKLEQTLKDKQAKPRCGLVVIDLNTGNIVHWVWIEGQVRELYDIQIIPEVKRASIVDDDAVEDLITFPNNYPAVNLNFSPQVNSPRTTSTNNVKTQGKINITPEVRAKLAAAQESFQQAQQLVVDQKIADAINSFQTAIALYPDYAAAYHGLGMVFWQESKYELAQECFERVISLDANSASAHLNLGNVFRQQGKLERAISAYQTAVEINSHYAPAWHNLGLIYQSKKQLELAESSFARAIKEDKLYFSSYLELGKIWNFTNRISKSKQLYQEALKRNPSEELHKQFTNLLTHAKIKLSNYSNYDNFQVDINQQLRKCIQQKVNHQQFELFDLLNIEVDNELFLEIAKLKSQEISQSVNQINFRDRQHYPQDKIKNKIKIGYVSPDFRSHAVGRLIHDIFRHHNRSQFEVYGYYLIGIIEDEYTQKIKQNCDVFRCIQDLSPQEAAWQINQDGIDILVDLAGYTYGSNPAIFALQPAPVQVSYLGYSATMGAEFMQYILADKWLIPESHQKYYSEKVLYLPQGFVGSEIEMSETKKSKSQLGLPEASFIFTCTNHYRKINSSVWQTWMEILHRVPNSILWLRNCPEEVQHNLRQNAVELNIEPERLIFAKKTASFAEYLQELTLADLFLDTFTYNAGSTAVACLQAGLPLLTKVGDKYVSRMGASICAAAGLESMICQTIEEYQQRAIFLAHHPQELQEIKQHLQQQTKLPLFNMAQFVANLEAVYLEIFPQKDYSLPNKLIDPLPMSSTLD